MAQRVSYARCFKFRVWNCQAGNCNSKQKLWQQRSHLPIGCGAHAWSSCFVTPTSDAWFDELLNHPTFHSVVLRLVQVLLNTWACPTSTNFAWSFELQLVPWCVQTYIMSVLINYSLISTQQTCSKTELSSKTSVHVPHKRGFHSLITTCHGEHQQRDMRCTEVPRSEARPVRGEGAVSMSVCTNKLNSPCK